MSGQPPTPSHAFAPNIRAILDTPGPADPAVSDRPGSASDPRISVRELVRAIRDFYRVPSAKVALLVTSLLLCYGGGAAMFWFHSVHLGEGGPAISWEVHWLIDSSVAFIALTPALALILPLSVWAAQSVVAPRAARLVPWTYAAIGGIAFAVATTPGPIAHDNLVGRGTWLAARVTELLGDPSATLAPGHEYGLLAAMTQQFGFGVPLYVLLMALSVVLLRRWVRPAPRS